MKAQEIALRSLAEIDARIEAWKQFGYPHPAACNCSPCIHERRVAQTEKDIAECQDALQEFYYGDWEDNRRSGRRVFLLFALGAAVVLAGLAWLVYSHGGAF